MKSDAVNNVKQSRLMVDCLGFVKNGRLIGGVFTVTLLGSLNITRTKNNEHNFNILGGNMKQSGMKPRTALILIAIIFIFAGSFDYADQLNNEKAQAYNEQ